LHLEIRCVPSSSHFFDFVFYSPSFGWRCWDGWGLKFSAFTGSGLEATGGGSVGGGSDEVQSEDGGDDGDDGDDHLLAELREEEQRQQAEDEAILRSLLLAEVGTVEYIAVLTYAHLQIRPL
jgi:hypothetical protein